MADRKVAQKAESMSATENIVREGLSETDAAKEKKEGKVLPQAKNGAGHKKTGVAGRIRKKAG
jgi:hypothetical protein